MRHSQGPYGGPKGGEGSFMSEVALYVPLSDITTLAKFMATVLASM